MTPVIKMAESEYMIPVNFMKEVEELRAYPKNIKTKIPIVKRDENGYRKRLSDTGRALGKD